MKNIFKRNKVMSFETYDDSDTYKRHFSVWIGRIESTVGKYKWEWHQNDADHFPSFPHLHSMDKENLKMNIYTGELYDNKNNSLNKNIGHKQLEKLWSNKQFYNFVLLKRDEYNKCIYDGNHFKDLPDIPQFE